MFRFVALLVSVLLATSCGLSVDDAAVDSGLSGPQAACFERELQKRLGDGAADLGAELTPERLTAMYEATSACRLGGAARITVAERVGYGSLEERDLNNAVEEMTIEEIAEQAERVGKDGGYLTVETDELRKLALDDLILDGGYTLREANCIIDLMYAALGKRGLDFSETTDIEVIQADAEARSLCT